MVLIKNIQITNGIISASCFIEADESKVFTIKIKADSFEVIENSLGYNNTYSRMAVNKIRSTFMREGLLPDELMSVWC